MDIAYNPTYNKGLKFHIDEKVYVSNLILYNNIAKHCDTRDVCYLLTKHFKGLNDSHNFYKFLDVNVLSERHCDTIQLRYKAFTQQDLILDDQLAAANNELQKSLKAVREEIEFLKNKLQISLKINEELEDMKNQETKRAIRLSGRNTFLQEKNDKYSFTIFLLTILSCMLSALFILQLF